MKLRALGLALGALAVAACAERAAFPAPAPAVAAAAEADGYLSSEAIVRLMATVPAAPEPGSALAEADRAGSAAWIPQEDSDRWRLAQMHAELAPALGVQHFDCPLHTRLSEEPPPRLVALLQRALQDAGAASGAAKRARGFRSRPFVDDPARHTCIRSDDLRDSSSYPSGHGTAGTLWGLIMADVAPDQAAEMRRRGDEIGLSRVVCGLHYPSDVAAGQALGRSLYTEIAVTPAYAADVAAARDEVARARTLGRTNPGCAAERLALAGARP